MYAWRTTQYAYTVYNIYIDICMCIYIPEGTRQCFHFNSFFFSFLGGEYPSITGLSE